MADVAECIGRLVLACVAGCRGLRMLASMLLRALFAASLVASLNSALAQAPPPVPALPDTIRQTTYSISSSTCACAVGFQLYGDQTDVDNWVQVFVNATSYLSTDPTFGWSLSSPTGPLSSIPRPITDAVLTFNNAQTGTITITGAQRPRRLQTFAENQGITARQFNQIFNTAFAQLRELWDRGKTILTGSVRVTVRSSSATSITASASTDYFFCLDPTANPITVNLPTSPAAGLTFVVKDCSGAAASHPISIVPASGTIDGAILIALSAAYASVAVTYNGVQWSAN
jgi:hypothetical protein